MTYKGYERYGVRWGGERVAGNATGLRTLVGCTGLLALFLLFVLGEAFSPRVSGLPEWLFGITLLLFFPAVCGGFLAELFPRVVGGVTGVIYGVASVVATFLICAAVIAPASNEQTGTAFESIAAWLIFVIHSAFIGIGSWRFARS